jgi:hypothetical protein
MAGNRWQMGDAQGPDRSLPLKREDDLRIREASQQCFEMSSGAKATALPTSSEELEFSLVLARVIGSIENDPAQLRNAVYELARIKLEREAWQRHPPMNVSEMRRVMLALDGAIDRVESVSAKHDERRALRSLDRLLETSDVRSHPSMSIDRNSVLLTDQAASPARDSAGFSQVLRAAAPVSRHIAREWLRSGTVRLLVVLFVIGLAVKLILDRQSGLFSSGAAPKVEMAAPAGQKKGDAVESSPAIRQQSPSLPLPSVYGVYAISGGQLNELEPLSVRAPDQRIFMSTAIKTPSRTILPDGRVVFIVFRRDIATSAPDRGSVRVIAKIAQAMTFNPKGTARVTPVEDEWTIRSTSYELRVAPMNENPEMLLFRPENSEFQFSPGRYALVLKGQAFDFTVAGQITEAVHCLTRTEAANGAFYSECRNP